MRSSEAIKLYDVNSDTRIEILFIETNLRSKKLHIPRTLNCHLNLIRNHIFNIFPKDSITTPQSMRTLFLLGILMLS